MNPNLPRLKPNPIPKIAPIPEHLAEPALKEIYEDTKAALQVPWMGVVAMSFARYPQFYATLWGGFRELSASAQFLTACHELRQEAESISLLRAPSILRKLYELGYTEPEIAEIRALIEIFSHGNMPYLFIATAARLLLEGSEIGTSRSISKPVQSRHGPAAGGKLVLMEPHHAERQLQALYDDLKSTIGLPFLNTDYRALARWPSYFDVAWRSTASAGRRGAKWGAPLVRATRASSPPLISANRRSRLQKYDFFGCVWEFAATPLVVTKQY